MGWLIIMAVFIVLIILSFVFWDANCAGGCFALAVACCFIGLWSSFGGYEEPYVEEEYNLIPIFDQSNIYIIETESGTKIYKCKEKSQYDDIQQVVIKEKGNSVEIEYAKEYSHPVLRKYVQKPVESIWNGVYCEDNEYYVLFASEECVMK